MEKVTRKNCTKLNRFEHKTLKNKDGSRVRARRNGNTKVWKSQPDRFIIPCKYGIYKSVYIDENNAYEWEGEE
jgi:hypothetical protein